MCLRTSPGSITRQTGRVPTVGVCFAHSGGSRPSPRFRPGAHRLAYNRDGVTVAPLSTAAMTTQSSRSTLLACVGRGVISAHAAPSDSFGNRYDQVGTVHSYTQWLSSGTALYSCRTLRGGVGHQVAVAKPGGEDETTLSVVDIVSGAHVSDAKWHEVAAGRPLTSPAVTTTGPALLVVW